MFSNSFASLITKLNGTVIREARYFLGRVAQYPCILPATLRLEVSPNFWSLVM